MKKILFLTLIFSAIISTTMHAQQQQAGVDQAAMLQQMKERVKPQMVEKTGLTEAQADKVIEINFQMRQSLGNMRDLSEAERSQKIQEAKAARDKKYSEIPLTDDQIKAVKDFYENMGKPKAN